MGALAERNQLTPSEKFLAWLEGQELSLFYGGSDERGYFVLIAVVPKQLDLETLLRDRVVDRVVAKVHL